MNDPVLQKAELQKTVALSGISKQRAVIADAQALITRFEAEVAQLDEFIATWYKLAGIQPPRPPEQNKAIDPPPRKRLPNPPREFVAKAAAEIIHRHGKPMSRKELFDTLAQRGIVIRGKDPEMVLSTMLWREPKTIVRFPQFGYWPAEQPYSPASYHPDLRRLMDPTAKEPEGGVEADDVDDELPLEE